MKRKAEKNELYKENTRFIIILVIMGALYLALVGRLTVFEMFEKTKYGEPQYSRYNERVNDMEKDVLRGSIYDANGVELAVSEFVAQGQQERKYPYNNLYCHVIGYKTAQWERSQLEETYNYALSGKRRLEQFKLVEDTERGDDVHLTLHHPLQEAASKALRGREGAVVALNPETGAVLCMVSYPDFNPNIDELKANYNQSGSDLEKAPLLYNSELEGLDAPLLNRATSGLYPPGSTLKVLWAAASLEEDKGDLVIEDNGEITVSGKVFANAKKGKYPETDMENGLKRSSNVYFIRLCQEIGAQNMLKYAEKAMLGAEMKDLELHYQTSALGYADTIRGTDLAAAAIGQGKIQVTPLYMAMLCGAIANDGVMMQPHFVKQVTDQHGKTVQSAKIKEMGKVFGGPTARRLTAYMETVVTSGTGTGAQVYGVKVAGKTGTAETNGENHSWFIGFTPDANQKIAVAVVLENGGSGAAEVAAKVIAAWQTCEKE